MPTERIQAQLRFTAVDKVTQRLRRMGQKFGTLGKKVSKAQRRFKAFERSTRKLRGSLDKTGRSMIGLGRKATRGLTLPIIAGMGLALREGFNFQKAINKTGALTGTFAEGQIKNFNKIENAALEYGRTTAFTATQVANGMSELAKRGLEWNEILAATPGILDLAVGTEYDLADSAKFVATALQTFGLEAKESTRVATIFAKAVNNSGVDMESLQESMVKSGPIAREFGASIEETVSILALLGDAGVTGGIAGTALKTIFTKLATPSSKASKYLKQLGVTVEGNDGKLLKATDILTNFAVKLKQVRSQSKRIGVVKELFGRLGIVGASAVMRKMTESLSGGETSVSNFRKELETFDDYLAVLVKNMRRAGVGDIQNFISAISGAAISLSKSGFFEILTSAANVVTKLAVGFSNLSERTRFWVGSISIIAALGPALIFLGKLYLGFSRMILITGLFGGSLQLASKATKIWSFTIGVASKMTWLVTAATWAWGVAVQFALSPVTLIILSIIALVGAFYLLYRFRKPITEFFTNMWDGALRGIKVFGDYLSNIYQKVKKFMGLTSGSVDINVKETQIGANGAPVVGSAVAQNRVNREYVQRTNNARVDVTVQAPEGTKVVSQADGSDGFFGVNVGRSGVYAL